MILQLGLLVLFLQLGVRRAAVPDAEVMRRGHQGSQTMQDHQRLWQDELSLLQMNVAYQERAQDVLKASRYRWPNNECAGKAANLSEGEGDGTFWRCTGGYCVNFDQRCDGNQDCGDGSDEFACGDSFRLTESVGTLENTSAILLDAITGARSDSQMRMAEVAELKDEISKLNGTLQKSLGSLQQGAAGGFYTSVNAARGPSATAEEDKLKAVLANLSSTHQTMQGEINALQSMFVAMDRDMRRK